MLINSGSLVLHMWLNPEFDHMPQLRYIAFTISFIGTMSFGYAMYHCIYKKPGTKLLTFCLIASVATLAANPLLYLNGKMPLPNYIPYYSSYLIFTQALGLGWTFLCWKMLKINKELKRLLRQ